MMKHFVSVLLGLASLVTLFTGVTMQQNQNDIIPVKTEESVVTNETSDSDFNDTDFIDIVKETEETIGNEIVEATKNEVEIEKVTEVKEVEEAVKETVGETQRQEPSVKETNPPPTEKSSEEDAATKPEVTVPAETSPPQSSDSNYANEVLRLVNVEREKAGKSALAMDSKLNQAAYKRSVEIVSVFSHTRPNGSSAFTVLDEFGINAQSAGENIAWGQRSPSEVVNGWMNSDGHRANILGDKFGKLGVGVHEENGRLYWTQFFTN